MKTRIILAEVLPIIGMIGLLGLWAFQQVGIDERSTELRKLSSAYSQFQTYQSNNAIFNAMISQVENIDSIVERIRTLQLHNYETGLQAIEQALPEAEKTDIPTRISAFGSTEPLVSKMRLLQERLEKLQIKLKERRNKISEETIKAKKYYLWGYIFFSIIMVVGAVLKVLNMQIKEE